jgi:hypothetical protein
MCSLGDCKFVLENIYFPQSEILDEGIVSHRLNSGKNRFDTLCNVTHDCEFENVMFLLKYVCENTSRDNDFIVPKKVGEIAKKHIINASIKGMSFYTICPRNKIPDEPDNIKKFEEFCELMFHMRGAKYFNEVWYVIECGKHESDSNLHIHMLCDFKKFGSKFFTRDLKNYWLHYFPDKEHDITYKIPGKKGKKSNDGIHRVDCNTLQMIQDKKT